MCAYNACWEQVTSGPQAGAALLRIRRLCADAKQEATRSHAYTDGPKQRLSGLDPSMNKSYAMLYKLLQLAGALNEVVQNLGRRWSEESGATSNDGFKQAPVKTAKRAIEKVWRSYNGDPASLTDIVRTSIVCASIEQLESVASTIFGDKAVQIVRVKNRFDPNYDSSTTAGYGSARPVRSLDRSHLIALSLALDRGLSPPPHPPLSPSPSFSLYLPSWAGTVTSR